MTSNGLGPDGYIGPRAVEAWEAWMWDEPATITLTRWEFAVISDALELYQQATELFEHYGDKGDEPQFQRKAPPWDMVRDLAFRTDPHAVDTDRFKD